MTEQRKEKEKKNWKFLMLFSGSKHLFVAFFVFSETKTNCSWNRN